METHRKIHLLSQELIPVINDLDAEPKQVVLNHIKRCEECNHLYKSTVDFANSFPEAEIQDDIEIKPLKKLVQFNTGLKLLLIAVRVLILFYIFYSGFNYYDLETSGDLLVTVVQSTILLFYLPAAVFLNIFTFIFFNKKWAWISAAADLMIILLTDNILQLFI